MRLSFGSPHLSLTSLDPVDLPTLTVITGPNGVGKTHLLKAIECGHVRNDVTATNGGLILFADNASTVGDPETFQRSTIEAEQAQVWQAFQSFSNNNHLMMEVRNLLGSLVGVPPRQYETVSELCRAIEGAVANVHEDHRKAAQQRLGELKLELSRRVTGMLNSLPSAVRRMRSASERLSKPIYELECSEVLEEEDFGTSIFLGQSFSRLFLTYHNRFMQNEFSRFMSSEGKPTPYLPAADFELRYGQPPWDLVNKTLARFNPCIELVKPEGYPVATFTAYIRNRLSKRLLKYSDLSSGERVFFSLFASVYKLIDSRQTTILPKLLLLDEVEATLHPSMIRIFLRLIQETFVNDMKMHVILTTHSPTTVALADEDSIFVMKSEPKRLEKVGRNRAIAELMTGVPFLSLTFDGRRQVFVESPTDADVYSRLYSILRPHLDSERSLEFVAVGNGGSGSGCGQVKIIVRQLTEAGNSTVFGLLDWDGENEPTDRIKVLGYGRRNGLENVMLDPLLVACLIVRDRRRHLPDLGLDDNVSLRDIADSAFADAPRLVSLVQSRVLDLMPELTVPDEPVECVYQGGLTLTLRRPYLECDDHDLEAAVRKAFPSLNEIKARAGALTSKIADGLLREYRELIPREIVDTFHDLLHA